MLCSQTWTSTPLWRAAWALACSTVLWLLLALLALLLLCWPMLGSLAEVEEAAAPLSCCSTGQWQQMLLQPSAGSCCGVQALLLMGSCWPQASQQ